MTDYNTDLIPWGDTGEPYPIGYSYKKGIPPVDEWDDFFNSNVEKDIKHLVDVTNSRLDSSYDQRPEDPTDGELYWGSPGLEVYDESNDSWVNVLTGGSGAYLPTAGGTMYGSIDFNNNSAENINEITSNDGTNKLEFVNGFHLSDSSLNEKYYLWYNKQTEEISLGSSELNVVFRSDAFYDGNTIGGVGQFQFDPDGPQPMFIWSDSGFFSIRDADQQSKGVLSYGTTDDEGKRWVIDGGRVFNEGGSFYMANSGNENNDSFDLVFENEPSGKDFRIHLKQDPENSDLEGTFGALFSTNDMGPHIAVDVNTGIVHTDELRSSRANQSGTPLSRVEGKDLNVGEVAYNEAAGHFIGKESGGNIVRFGG